MEVEILQSKPSLFSLCLIIPYYLINTNFMAEDTSISISLSRKCLGKKPTLRYKKTINLTLNLSCLTVFFFSLKQNWSFDHLLFQYLLKFIIMKAIPTSVSTFFLPLKWVRRMPKTFFKCPNFEGHYIIVLFLCLRN